MDVLSMIDALEDMAENGRRVPGTGRVMVDRDELAGLIDKMRTTVPAELREADEIRSQSESIVNEAYVFAKKMKAKTEIDHRQAIEASAVVDEAHSRAEQIRQEAEGEAEKMKQRIENDAARLIRDSDDYAAQCLERLSNHLDQVSERIQALHTEAMELRRAIENGMRYLSARRTATTAGAPTHTGYSNGNGNGHGNGNGNGYADLNEEDLLTLAGSSKG